MRVSLLRFTLASRLSKRLLTPVLAPDTRSGSLYHEILEVKHGRIARPIIRDCSVQGNRGGDGVVSLL
jgi:hypothetical protein